MNSLAEGLKKSSVVFRTSREAHCQRVAALAREIARLCPYEGRLEQVEAVGWLHECPRDVFTDLAESNPVVRGLLGAQGKDPGSLVAEIVTLANAFDEMIEWLPVEHQTVTQMLEELSAMNALGLWRPEVETALGRVARNRWETVLAAGNRLPVTAVGSVRNLGVIPPDEVTAELLYDTASQDPVLTADILRVVNSWASPSLRKQVSSLREGICYLGTGSARAVILASAARRLFSSKTIVGIWKHSIEVAAHARHLGGLAGCDPEVAFLGGLMHDIGRLAIEMLDAETLAMRSRLREQGLPVVWVDLVTCRHDHAEIGGALLWQWNFPQTVVDAVALHHSPERSASKLASVLYLAEMRTREFEEEPSLVKLDYALGLAGLTRKQIRESNPEDLYNRILAA